MCWPCTSHVTHKQHENWSFGWHYTQRDIYIQYVKLRPSHLKGWVHFVFIDMSNSVPLWLKTEWLADKSAFRCGRLSASALFIQVYGLLESDRRQLESNIKSDQRIFVRFQLLRLLVHARHFTHTGRQAGSSSWMAGHSQTSLGRRRFALTLLEE